MLVVSSPNGFHCAFVGTTEKCDGLEAEMSHVSGMWVYVSHGHGVGRAGQWGQSRMEGKDRMLVLRSDPPTNV